MKSCLGGDQWGFGCTPEEELICLPCRVTPFLSSSSSSLEHNSLSLKEKGKGGGGRANRKAFFSFTIYCPTGRPGTERERGVQTGRQTGGDGGSPPEATDLSWDSEKEGRKDASIADGSVRLVDNA